MGKFGWSYPPGCSGPPDEYEGPCEVCGYPVDDCVCPECPRCLSNGDPACYQEVDLGVCAGLYDKGYSNAQLLGRARRLVQDLKDQLREAEDALPNLERAASLDFLQETHKGHYDTALPQIWVDQVRSYMACQPVGHFVWLYDEQGGLGGRPYPLDSIGQKILKGLPQRWR